MPRNSKRRNYAEVFTHEQDGKVYQRISRVNYSIDSEDSYVKFYFEGLDYIRDMPRDCFVIHLTSARKKKIAQEMGYSSVKPVSNLLTELCYGEALVRMETACYRLNPYICGRGAWADIISVREQGEFNPIVPGSTFMSVYQARVRAIRSFKEQQKRNEEARAKALADYTVDPETGEAIPLFEGDTDILPY